MSNVYSPYAPGSCLSEAGVLGILIGFDCYVEELSKIVIDWGIILSYFILLNTRSWLSSLGPS